MSYFRALATLFKTWFLPMPAHDDPRVQKLLQAQQEADEQSQAARTSAQAELNYDSAQPPPADHDDDWNSADAAMQQPAPFGESNSDVTDPDDPSITAKAPAAIPAAASTANEAAPSAPAATSAHTAAASPAKPSYDPNAPWGDPDADDSMIDEYADDRDNPAHFAPAPALEQEDEPVDADELATESRGSESRPASNDSAVPTATQQIDSDTAANPADFSHLVKPPEAADERASRTPFRGNPFAAPMTETSPASPATNAPEANDLPEQPTE